MPRQKSARVRNLLTRSGRHWARLVVPAALRPIVGKRELLESLGADRKEALRRLPAVVGRMQAELKAARESLTPARPQRITVGRPMTDRGMARAHYERELALDHAERNFQMLARVPHQPVDRELVFEDGTSGAFSRDVPEQPEMAAHQPYSVPPADPSLFRPAFEVALKNVASGRFADDEGKATVGWILDGFRAQGVPVPEVGTMEWRERVRVLAGVQLEILQRSGERDQGNFSGAPMHPALVTPAPAPDDPLLLRRLSDDSDRPLSQIVPMMLADRKAGPQTRYEYGVLARMFEEFMGEEKPVYRITRQNVRAFKQALSESPANCSKRFPGLSLPDAIPANKARKTPYPVLQGKSVNKYLAKISTALGWCVRQDILPDNPAEKIKVESSGGKAMPARVPFSSDDLKRIFAPKVFAPPFGEAEWAMVISLYTGMRASELGQLKLASIREERGVLVFAIEEETKNLGSQRIIPVHRKLIDLGLNERVAQIKRDRQTHLFPHWYRQAQDAQKAAEASGSAVMLGQYYPRFLPKRFNVSYLPKIGIDDRRKRWHSFRHTFKTGLAFAGIELSIQDQLCGHADHTAGALYIHGVSVESLNAAVDKLAFL